MDTALFQRSVPSELRDNVALAGTHVSVMPIHKINVNPTTRDETYTNRADTQNIDVLSPYWRMYKNPLLKFEYYQMGFKAASLAFEENCSSYECVAKMPGAQDLGERRSISLYARQIVQQDSCRRSFDVREDHPHDMVFDIVISQGGSGDRV